ncbi:MAG: RidA family protein, partial [Dehalococcoidia bacterium]
MPVERINPEGVAKPPGYSHVVKVGNTVYIAGQVARDLNGNPVGAGDFAKQTEEVFRNLKTCLASVGASISNLAKITILLTRAEDVAAFREIRDRYLDPNNLPASTLMVISRLAHPDFLVEIEGIAVLG